jgi:hypothetical protein
LLEYKKLKIGLRSTNFNTFQKENILLMATNTVFVKIVDFCAKLNTSCAGYPVAEVGNSGINVRDTSSARTSE